MRPFILSVIALVFAFSSACTQNPGKKSIDSNELTNLNPMEFKDAITNAADNYIILDVRTPEEWSDGIIEGAYMVNYYDDNFENQLKMLPPDKQVFVYCRSGGRSSQAVSSLQKIGYTRVVNLEGGMLAWSKAGLPIVNFK
jgi:rhodanese-related sulfurtransferase